MSNIRLKLDDDLFLEDIEILGIVSELPPYRLCYFLNEDLSFRLRRSESDKPFYYKRKELVKYAHYEYIFDEQSVNCFLTANKNPERQSSQKNNTESDIGIISGLPLIPNLKIFDYFLWFEGETQKGWFEMVLEKIKRSAHIRTLRKINPSETKNIQNLLFH